MDFARGLAVFGMFAAHVGPTPEVGGPLGALMELANGRASALFATLAGLSLAIMSGRAEPATGLAGRRARAKITIRAVILFLFGTLLTMTGTSVVVILAYYGLFFLLALPFTRLRAVPLAILAAVWAIAGPVLSFVVRDWLTSTGLARTLIAHDPIRMIGGESAVQFFLTGGYPVLTWMPFVFAGMALGRLDLTAVATRIRLAIIGPVLAVAGYGGSWLLVRLVPGANFPPRLGGPKAGDIAKGGDFPKGGDMPASGGVPNISELTENGEPMGAVPTDSALRLLGSESHSGVPFEIVGAVGVAIIALVGSLFLAEKLPKWCLPVTAVGSMSLTAYVLHVIAIDATGSQPGAPVYVLLAFIAGVVAFALVWSRFFRRGPLEFLLGKATAVAQKLK
ncbi:hypothetical protein UK23_19505 [Lentzea aerocolonigenes]|uniref:DUF418 domain-containing protein n=1 Tax=Lentzea aerocolonigenes TaxID=68170 RepID=A0A0F0H0E8_LENAE|nr:hypothetical protein UK23_19505 [Lentzea aerocolonigenes]